MSLPFIRSLPIAACLSLLSASAIANSPAPLDPDKFEGTWIVKDEKTGSHCLVILQSNGKRAKAQVAYSYNSFWEFLTWSDCEKVLGGEVKGWIARYTNISIIMEPLSDGKVNNRHFNAKGRTAQEIYREDFVSRDGLVLSKF